MSEKLERLKARFGQNMVDQDWDKALKVCLSCRFKNYIYDKKCFKCGHLLVSIK